MYNIVNTKMAKYIRIRCPYCWKAVRSNGNGEIIYSRDKRAADEVKAYMKLYTIGADSSKVIKMRRKPLPLGMGSVSSVTSGRGCA